MISLNTIQPSFKGKLVIEPPDQETLDEYRPGDLTALTEKLPEISKAAKSIRKDETLELRLTDKGLDANLYKGEFYSRWRTGCSGDSMFSSGKINDANPMSLQLLRLNDWIKNITSDPETAKENYLQTVKRLNESA